MMAVIGLAIHGNDYRFAARLRERQVRFELNPKLLVRESRGVEVSQFCVPSMTNDPQLLRLHPEARLGVVILLDHTRGVPLPDHYVLDPVVKRLS